MKFKELVTFVQGTKRIDYQAIDPAHDNITNKLFGKTRIIEEGGQHYIVGTYTGELTLGSWDGEFPSEPEEPVVIRFITVRAFMKRFTQAERIFLRLTQDDTLIDMMEDLKMASYVDLQDAELAAGIAQVVQLPSFTSMALVILREGEEHEEYRGVL